MVYVTNLNWTTQLKNLEKEGETFQHHFGCQNNRNNCAKFQRKEKKINEICSTFMNSETNRCWQEDVANSSCCCSAEPELLQCKCISRSLSHRSRSHRAASAESLHPLCSFATFTSTTGLTSASRTMLTVRINFSHFFCKNIPVLH